MLRPAAPFVRTALRALAERARGPRARDAARAWRERACGDAAARPSRFSAARTARPRLGFGFRPARRVALAADARLFADPAARRRRKLHAGATGLRQPDGDGLLRRARTVFAFPHVLDLLVHKGAGLRGRRGPFFLQLL